MDINPFGLHGLVALITGAASGIGEATARVFMDAGASVIIVDVDEPRAQALSGSLPGSSYKMCDVTDESSVTKLFSKIERLDILVNNAGIGLVGDVTETSLDDFRRLFRVNVDGVFLMTRAAIPLLIDSHGTIVNIASVAGLVGIKRRFAYCATKGAVIAMTRQVAVDYPIQLRANCICPGTVDSPFVEQYLDKYHRHEKEEVRAELHRRQPMGRMGRPEEVANLALYLASQQAAFVHGSVFTIDGGLSAA
jgi:2-keto-3-deoxy-L-fuconate dehydrogenase